MTAPTGEHQPSPTPAPAPQPAPAPAPQPTPGPAPAPQPQPERTFTQAEFNAFEARVKREFREKAEAVQADADFGKRLKELFGGGTGPTGTPEEQVQQLTTASTQKDQRITELEADKLRYKLAATAGLHPTLWDRVRGNDETAILADIETLKPASAALGATPAAPGAPTPPAPAGPQPNPQQGTPSANDGKTGSVKSGADLFAQRNGKSSAAT